MPEHARPTRRADAERNRDKIVAAARQAFADSDREISMAEVARRAGVGMATLYRNFPGRRELLQALYTDEVDAVCASAGTEGDTAGEQLVAWLHRFSDFVRSKGAVAADLLAHTDDATPFLESGRDRVLAAAGPLLEAAHRSGEVRAELDLVQILELVIAVGAIRGEEDHVRPILDAALRGLS